MQIIKPEYEINIDILSLLDSISQSQGFLNASRISFQDFSEINALANIDAIHHSTRLEGNRLTHRQVTAIITEKESRVIGKYVKDIQEVINYAKARDFLKQDKVLAGDVNKELLAQVHSLLMNRIVTGKLKGYYRQAQNVIRDSKSNEIVYMPPEAKDVSKMMQKLYFWVKEALLNNESPLITAALFHYYFVTIHPFMDGNGRCGRLITNFILDKQGFNVSRYASIEKVHEQNKMDYYRNLRIHQALVYYDIPDNINLTGWIKYWLLSIKKAYDEAIRRLNLNIDQENLDERLKKAFYLFFRHKKLKASEYQILAGLGRTQAVSDLNKLISNGLIKKAGGGRSSTYIVSEQK
jgi:Fic family protein